MSSPPKPSIQVNFSENFCMSPDNTGRRLTVPDMLFDDSPRRDSPLSDDLPVLRLGDPSDPRIVRRRALPRSGDSGISLASLDRLSQARLEALSALSGLGGATQLSLRNTLRSAPQPRTRRPQKIVRRSLPSRNTLRGSSAGSSTRESSSSPSSVGSSDSGSPSSSPSIFRRSNCIRNHRRLPTLDSDSVIEKFAKDEDSFHEFGPPVASPSMSVEEGRELYMASLLRMESEAATVRACLSNLSYVELRSQTDRATQPMSPPRAPGARSRNSPARSPDARSEGRSRHSSRASSNSGSEDRSQRPSRTIALGDMLLRPRGPGYASPGKAHAKKSVPKRRVLVRSDAVRDWSELNSWSEVSHMI